MLSAHEQGSELERAHVENSEEAIQRTACGAEAIGMQAAELRQRFGTARLELVPKRVGTKAGALPVGDDPFERHAVVAKRCEGRGRDRALCRTMTPSVDDPDYPGLENLECMAACARNYNEFLVREVERACAPARELVDLGAGIGTFARALVDRGYSVICVEPDHGLRRVAVDDRLTWHDCIADLEESSIDAVYALNVLEHIEDDVAVLRDVYGRLRPGGILFLYVPAFAFLYTSMDRRVGHHRRYTKPTLTARLCDAGFEVEAARYVDSLGVLATLVFKWFGNDHGRIDAGALALYDRVVFPASRAMDRVLQRIVGKNLAVRARRPR